MKKSIISLLLLAATTLSVSAQIVKTESYGRINAAPALRTGEVNEGLVAEPKGEKHVYTATLDMIQSGTKTLDGLYYELYFDNKDVYIKCLFSGAVYPFDTYIKATLEGNKIIIPTGAHYMNDRTWGYGMRVARVVQDAGKFVLDQTDEPIVWTVSDGVITEDDPNAAMALAIMEDFRDPDDPDFVVFHKDEIRYTVDNMKLEPMTEVAPAFPEGVQTEMVHFFTNYIFDETTVDWMGEMVRDGNDVYIKGLYYEEPQLMLKGTMQGDKVIFPAHQYMGVDWRGYHNYNTVAHLDMTTYEFVADDEDLVMDWDADAQKLTTTQWMMDLAGSAPQYYLITPEISVFTPVAAIPATPIFKLFQDYDYSWANYYSLVFDIPMADVDGNFINPDSITYCAYFNDDLFTFNPGEYAVDEPMTEIPFHFDNYKDIVFTTADNYTRHFIDIYDKVGVNKVGIQSIYTANGEKNVSDIMWYIIHTTGIDDVDTQANAIKHEYFDISGHRLPAPAAGVNIHRVTYGDGSVKTYKELVK